jgi:hypothetical protein
LRHPRPRNQGGLADSYRDRGRFLGSIFEKGWWRWITISADAVGLPKVPPLDAPYEKHHSFRLMAVRLFVDVNWMTRWPQYQKLLRRTSENWVYFLRIELSTNRCSQAITMAVCYPGLSLRVRFHPSGLKDADQLSERRQCPGRRSRFISGVQLLQGAPTKYAHIEQGICQISEGFKIQPGLSLRV